MLNRVRLGAIGSDGFFTLALSTLLLIATGGVLLALLLVRIVAVARRAPTHVSAPGQRLVLGQMLERGQPGPAFRERLDRALELYRDRPDCKIVILGGRTSRHGPSEAMAGRRYLLARGVAAEQILTEDRSRHTLENLRHARQLLAGDPHRPILITNRFHLARSLTLAHGLGLEPLPCAADPQLRWSPQLAAHLLHEAYLLHWYHVGRAWSRLTGNRRMLARIT